MTHRSAIAGQGGGAVPWWLSGGIPSSECVAAYRFRGADSQAGSLLNLAISGTWDMSVSGTPTWASATGWTFGANNTDRLGAGAAGVTGLTADCTLVCKFAAGTGTGGRCLGGLSGKRLWRRHYTSGVAAWESGGRLDYSAVLTAGTLAVAGQRAFLDGSFAGTINTGSVSGGLFVGQSKAEGGYSAGAQIHAFSVYATTLADSSVAAVTAAMGAL